MKTQSKIFVLLMSFVLGSIVYGCSSEPDEPSFDPSNENSQDWDDNNTSSDDNESDSEIKRLIEECVKVNVRYSDYMWYFDIESTLHHKLPSKIIAFGIGHGDIDGIEHISVENDAYGYISQNDGRKKTFMFTNPFWFYYVWGMEPSDKDSWTHSEMYYATYKSLNDKGVNNLNKDEKALFDKLKGLLNDFEKPMILNYQPSIYVRVDSKFYLIGRYHIK